MKPYLNTLGRVLLALLTLCATAPAVQSGGTIPGGAAGDPVDAASALGAALAKSNDGVGGIEKNPKLKLNPGDNPNAILVGVAHISGEAWFDLGFEMDAGISKPRLTGVGSAIGGDPVSLVMEGTHPSALGMLVIGASALGTPFKGGVMLPSADALVLGLASDPDGSLVVAGDMPTGLPPDLVLYLQMWMVHPIFNNGLGWSGSNAVALVTP